MDEKYITVYTALNRIEPKNENMLATKKKAKMISYCENVVSRLINSTTKQEKEDICKEFEENMKCAICQDTIVDYKIIACGHAFCHTCITQWLIRNISCPDCRSEPRIMIFSVEIDNAINEAYRLIGGEIYKRRIENIKQQVVQYVDDDTNVEVVQYVDDDTNVEVVQYVDDDTNVEVVQYVDDDTNVENMLDRWT
ncbi:Zinc finger, RING-type,Zinc finger, RING/FYVE/PHD-type,Zinc finger, RING-type, conserved [Cinara cedri]|uniref:Zinc finger, RING-type,Zinc finger, RING/FYVE/PHD-type,Zinc finger, RING-type, conserved n=1 Tax=Cinara cedri TaxID=506608 RepID=A0A5E4MQW8_9HEMI|nr:Zinc finger, RING-type,Zinc finger, RING/FYVE/PHD-type,Zinc finger, RING-type, conserved [Cinara cedri]